jgi:hypothetical protein
MSLLDLIYENRSWIGIYERIREIPPQSYTGWMIDFVKIFTVNALQRDFESIWN